MLVLILLVCSLPITIALFGFLLWKFPPKTPKVFYGYRSKRSVLSIQAWNYANARAAHMMLRGSWIHFAIMLLIVLIYRFGSEISDPIQMANSVAFYPLIILTVQILFLYRKLEGELTCGFDAKGRPIKCRSPKALEQSKQN
ncbi:MAG: hypothetical protein ACC608_02455 [Anaerofustis sp.]|jgi:uncharacterized membrane protein